MALDAAAFAPDPESSGRARRWLATLALLYGAAAAVVLAVLPELPGGYGGIPAWSAIPVQLIAIGLSAQLALQRRSLAAHVRTAWAFVAGFSALSLVATLVWNTWRPQGVGPVLSRADALYLVDYGLMTVAYGWLFVHFRGPFRSRRTWLDAITILVALLAALWAVLLGPALHATQPFRIPAFFALSYSVTITVMLTMAALLCIRLPDLRRQRAVLLLVAAGVVDASWEIAWLAGWLADTDFVGAFYNFGDVICFALVAQAAASPQQPGPAPEAASAERSAQTFLPALGALLSIALVAASLTSTRATEAWILVGLVVLCALLLVTRQNAVRRELAILNRALAVREADARVTELVRQSMDLFLVVDSRGKILFASPAADLLAEIPARRLPGTNAAAVFGPFHEATLASFLESLADEPTVPHSIELSAPEDSGQTRVLRVVGSNQLANRHIGGMTLTITDVTEQRTLERQVLEAANEERMRLAGDIHDGLGQDLTGIALLLQGAAHDTVSPPVERKAALKMIVDLLNQAVRGARDLARGLSPIYVVRGSLREALQRLARDSAIAIPVHVDVDPQLDDRVVGDVPADHLYRIAREAVHNAAKHSGCTRIDVTARVGPRTVVITITDDGRGPPPVEEPGGGLGMRLMEYRARVVGGTLSIGREAHGGMRVDVRAPLRVESGPAPLRPPAT